MGPTRSLIIGTLLYSAALAIAILLLADIAAEIGGARSVTCESSPATRVANSTDLDAAFHDLIAMNYLAAGDRALCLGPESSAAAASLRRIGFSAVIRSPATACCGLPFGDDSFDFAFVTSLNRVRVPARVVLEMERVVRPGRIGVVLRIRSGLVRPEELMKAAAPVASLLRLSDVVGARAVNGSGLVVAFKKRSPSVKRRQSKDENINCSDGIPRLPLIINGIIEFLQSGPGLFIREVEGHSGHVWT